MEFLNKLFEFLLRPEVVVIVGAIVGFGFDVWKTAPKRALQRAIELITDYSPIIFNAVEEAARVAKQKEGADVEKIDKALLFEEHIKQLLKQYGALVNDEVIKFAHANAKSINFAKRQEEAENAKLLG